MPYDAMPLLCRRCLDARVPEGELIAYLDYVQARAAKRNQRCPLPGAPRWTEEPEPTE